MTVDPITFEIIRHRLYRVVEEAVITLKNVSGSPNTNEGHDLMVSLYTADGGLLMGGVGFLHHLSSASEACKAIIRRFGNRIEEDDMFLLNDPYTAALHTSDIYIISPIHFEGALVAWSACFVHVNDIGAMNPGGFSPESRDIFTEGFSSPGIRIIRRGEVCEDVLDTLLNMVRAPDMVALDIRSMIACNNVARQRLRELYEKYGLATVSEVGTTLIEQSEQLLRARLRELPDGSWTTRQYMDVEGKPLEICLTMTKQDDQLTYDFTGSSRQADRGVNCTKWAAWGALMAPLYPTLCHDITWNEGVSRPVTMLAPEGSIVNCTRPAPVSIATTAAVQAVNNVSLSCISKMLVASKTYAHEATAVWHGSHLCTFLFGRNHRGQIVIGSTTETFGGSGGARPGADGIDLGGEIPNPISRMANVETNEAMFPIRYLFRQRRRDSGGAGEFRGGTGGEYAIVPHDAPDGSFNFVVSGKGVDFPMGYGLAGGYPGAPGRYVIARGALGAGSRTPAPLSYETLGGEQQAVSWGVYNFAAEDVFYVRWNGAGGFGDPLARDPDALARDVAKGVVSRAAARDLYGAVIAPDGSVDRAATDAARQAMRSARSASNALTALPAGEARRCPQCGGGAALRSRLMSDIADCYTTGRQTLLAETVCASCGALIDAHVAKADEERREP